MAQGTIQGYRISAPFSLDGITNATESKIEWEAMIPDEEKTRIFIKTAVTNSNSEEPESWSEVTINGGQIPDIQEGDDLTGKYLWTKQILETDDPTISPQLDTLTETIIMAGETEGSRISPEFDVSGPEKVKNSRIFWQAKERFDGTIKIEVNVFDGTAWKGWQEAVNGTGIPGLESGTGLTGAKIQTKTSFVGGPKYYPSLENIKIFIETE